MIFSISSDTDLQRNTRFAYQSEKLNKSDWKTKKQKQFLVTKEVFCIIKKNKIVKYFIKFTDVLETEEDFFRKTIELDDRIAIHTSWSCQKD